MKAYLISTFQYNDTANKQLLEKIKQLPEQEACIKLFSHLINSQNKWMARIENTPKAMGMSWWQPLYPIDKLEEQWTASLNTWLKYLEAISDKELTEEVSFIGFDGGRWAAKPQDIALQLNYHAIHHRAQIQTLIRQQGLEPDFLDYIGTVYRKLK